MATVCKKGSVYYLVYRVNGKQRWESLGKGTTKKQALAIKAEREVSINQGAFANKTVSMPELVEQWLDSVQTQVKPTTYSSYAGNAKHIKGYFENVADVKNIGTDNIEKYIAAKLKTLSPKTVGYHLGTLKMIFAKALQWKYVYSDPCHGLKRPRCEDKEIQVLTEEQVDLLILEAEDRTALIISVAYRAGLRAGEICGLRWEDVDLVAGRIHINQTYTHGRFGSPKTRGSKRKVPIPHSLVDELARLKDHATEELVFHNNGQPISWSHFLHVQWDKLIKTLELPKVTPHSLRHLYGSLLLAHGEPLALVSKLMGHANVAITLKVYTHCLESSEVGIHDRLNRIFDRPVRRMLEESRNDNTPESVTLPISPVLP